MSTLQFEVVREKTAIRERTVIIVLEPSAALPKQFQVRYLPGDAVGHATQEIPHFRGSMNDQFIVDIPRRWGTILVHDHGGNLIGSATVDGAHFPAASSAIRSDDGRKDAARADDPADATDDAGPDEDDDDDGDHGGDDRASDDQRNHGGARHRRPRTSVVRLARTAARHVRGQHLWSIIKRSSDGLSFSRFDRFVELAFSDHPRQNLLERRVSNALVGSNDGDHRAGGVLGARENRDPSLFFRVDSYDRLKVVSEVFLLANAGVLPSKELSLIDRKADEHDRPLPKHPPVPRVVPGVTASINWCKFEITQFPIPRPPRPGGTTDKETASRTATPAPMCPSLAGGGVYIVMQGSKPIYVGETESFADRFHARLRDAFQIGLINIGDVTRRRPEHLADVPITMWLGVLPPDVSADKRKLQEKRKLLESAIIRALAKGGSWTTLRNDRSFNAFQVSTPLKITHVLPPELAQRLTFARHPKAKGPPSAQDAIDAGQIGRLGRSPAQLLDLKKNDVFELGFYETPRTATPPGYPRMT